MTPPAAHRAAREALIERLARVLYFASLQRDRYTHDDETDDEIWARAKEFFAYDSVMYTRPANAFADATTAVDLILSAIETPSEEQIDAAQIAMAHNPWDTMSVYIAMIQALKA